MSLFCAVTGVICHSLIYFSDNFWVIIGGFIFFGFGIGIGYYPILKNSWKYFPEKKGLITGIVLCAFGLSPFIFTTLADLIINPNGKYEYDKKKERYPKEVSENVRIFSLIMGVILFCFMVLSQILLCPLDDVVSTDKGYRLKIAQTHSNLNPEISNEINISFSVLIGQGNVNDRSEVSLSKKERAALLEPIIQPVKSLRYHSLNFMSVGVLCK